VHVPALHAAPEACANCDAPRMGEYCHACGQHFLDGRLTIRRLVRDFIVRKLGLEGGLLRTIVDLTIRPGRMIRDYVNGRRQRYTNPVAYLLLTASAYVLLSRTWQDAIAAGLRAENAGLEGVDSETYIKVQLYMDGHPSLFTLLICLFLVPALRLLFRRSTTIAEATVYSLYVSGHLLLMQAVINVAALMFAVDPYDVMTGWISVVPTMALLYGAGRFFDTGFSSYLKMTLALLCAVLGLLVVMFTGMIMVGGLAAVVPPVPGS
jgi:hypothetical protein